jgi:putative methyltransferase (TIGR04325 family)
MMTPPIIGSGVRRIRGRSADNEWEYLGDAWPSGTGMRGWDVSSVVETQRTRLSDLERAIARPDTPVADDLAAHNTMMCFAYVVGRAATARSVLSILDWGGGLGQYGLIARGMYPALEIDYHCRDLPLMTQQGRARFPETTFYEDDEGAFARSYDLVMASSSLQYVETWRETLRLLAQATGRFLYLTRQPVAFASPSFVVRQRPWSHGYDTEYPGWVLNRSALLRAIAELGLVLRREFVIGEGTSIHGAPEPVAYRGFLFERTRA